MDTEIILVEVSVYEKNLKELLSEYERIRTNYVASLQANNTADTKRILLQLESMNQEIQLLATEISDKIKKINEENKYDNYKSAVQTKKDDLNNLNNKMTADEIQIKQLLHDMIDLNGKNETLRLQQKANIHYIYFGIIFLIFLSILYFRLVVSTEQSPIENIVFFLAIVLLIYFCWRAIFG
jgi:hypothetical protein